MNKIFNRLTSVLYLFVSITLISLAIIIIGFSLYELIFIKFFQHANLVLAILQAIGAVVIATAIIDVAKYMFEEEVIKGDKELRKPEEARETLTKIIVIISIAISVEGLVYIVKAGAEDMRLLIYPASLVLSSTAMVVGLGLYQKLSTEAEERSRKSKEKHLN